jgi:hypothetical protein
VAAGTSGIASSKNTGVTEISLNKSALGALSTTIRVAYLDLNTSYTLISKLPSTGAYVPYVITSGTVTIPTAPSTLSTSAVSSTQINLSWTDNSSNESGFRIERSTGTSTTYTEIATTGAGVNTYSNTSLTASTQYNYRVRVYNTAGNSAYTNISSATTPSTSAGIIIDGSLAEWSAIPTVTTATSQTALSIKVSSTATNLYFGIAGSGMSTTHYEIFIDTDNNAATGFQDTRFTSSGANYMIENGALYQSTGTGWSWTGVTATIVVSKNASVTEISINRSALGTLASTIRVAYFDLNTSFVMQSKLPATGGYAPFVLGSARLASNADELQIINEEASDSFMVYPNPASGQYLAVESDEIIKELSVHAVNGMRIHFDAVSDKKKTIETSEWSKGVYILKAVTVPGRIRIVKVIK